MYKTRPDFITILEFIGVLSFFIDLGIQSSGGQFRVFAALSVSTLFGLLKLTAGLRVNLIVNN
jgi:hypothetical protein